MKKAVSVSLLLVLAALQCSGQQSSGNRQREQTQRDPERAAAYAPSPTHQRTTARPASQEYLGAEPYPGQPSRVPEKASNPPPPRHPYPFESSNANANFDNVNNNGQASSVSPQRWGTPEPTPSRVYPSISPKPTKLQTVPTNGSPSRGGQPQAPFSGWNKYAAANRKKVKTSTTSGMAMSPPRPNPTGDRLLYDPPGANGPNTTINGLALAIEDGTPDSAVDINNGLRQFALDLLMEMSSVSPGKNVVMSPYSVWAVMLVIYEGALGQTAAQIAKTLMFKDKKHKVRANYQRLEVALRKANEESQSDFVNGNGIFYDVNRPPLPEFQRFAQTGYQCTLNSVDFSKVSEAVKTINKWVAEVTRDRIKMLVKTEDIGQPELIITNALFFKGQWKIPFNMSATHTDKFYDERKQHVADVRMMYQKGEYMYSYISEIGAHVLDMPYRDSKFRMLVVLPKPASTVDEVLKLMKQFPIDQCYERLVHEQEMFSEDEVHVYLPRFKFRNRMELSPNLRNMGITDVFDSSRANLTAMSHARIFLGKVFHVTEIEVNEEGTIASAATAGSFVNKMGPPKFLANRPFAYFIVESSQKTVIFAGKVVNPNLSS